MGDKVEYVTTYWVEGGTLVQRCDTLEGCDLIHERIVRCRDCVYASAGEAVMSGNWRLGTCSNRRFIGSIHRSNVTADGFCAWGKVR